ncbi:PQQ-binding-like beta-propeller repeat protein [Singulisphaera sp. Ch08]|uniref:PQQ-binding-like beta-propeller repeat protein n=1 Tax=Singulisphaera sp. Ch08 TaxID=3120278 RepID=A0AAU7CPY9_9BACT
MATLEVHDGQGRVQRVTITREQTVLFGSSPKCEIVLNGDGVLPFHGRLRWKSSRYKADASPDAGAIEINGRRMASSSFRQGDEIVVGPCRIFMIHADEDLPQDDKTRIQPAPFISTAPATTTAKSRSRVRPGKPFERQDWIEDLAVAPPSAEMAVAPSDSRERGGRHKSRRPRADAKSKTGKRGVRGLFDRFFSTQVAPGEERVLTSPLVFGLVGAVVVLVVLGFALNTIIARTVTTRMFHRAVESLDDGDYRNAIRRFDEFLARKSGDESRDSKARVLRALANVRQFTSSTGASWSNALTAEREMLDQVGDEPAFRDSSIELAELVLKTGESLADRARVVADAASLGEAESALALHARVAGSAKELQLGRSKLPAKISVARAAVRKGAIRSQSLVAMDAAIQAGSAGDAYKARDALVRQYADLAGDRELIARMTRANDLIRRAVTFDSSRRPAETEPHREPLGPPTSFVLRSKQTDATSTSALDQCVFALADGYVYGIKGETGAPIWQVPVGLSSPFSPLAISGGTTVLAFDSRHDELVKLNAKTGELIWRQGLGGPIDDPPLVLGNQVIQAAPDGNVYVLDLVSGELRATYRLGLPLTRSPISDESGQYLYVLANQDCLFVLKRDPISCEAVEYLGHAPGSLPCTPARLGRFLVIPENHALTEGRWRVCILEDDGARIRQGQQVAIPGWTRATPASSGSVIWATGDRAGVAAYAIGDYGEKAPFRLIAQFTADAKSSGPAFGFARSEHELWLSGGRPGRYDLSVEKGALDKVWSLTGVGPALAPLQVVGSSVVLTHQFIERPGVSLWGLDPKTGIVRWQTVLGSAWPLALQNTPRSDELTTLGMDGQRLSLSDRQLRAGGFLESTLPRPAEFRIPVGVERRLEGEGSTILVPGSSAKQLLVSREGGAFRPIDLPVALGASPLFWGRDVLIPGSDGRAYLIDPTTGESRAEPFVPDFDRTHATSWRAPARLDDDAVVLVDDAGKVRRLTLVNDPRPRLVASVEVSLGASLLADPVSTGSAIVLATSDGRLRSLAARDLSPIGAWPVESSLAMLPTSLGSLVFATDQSGGVYAFGADGQRIWSTKLRGTGAVSAPAILDDSVSFLTQDGVLHRLSLTDGSPLDRIELNLLPAGDLLTSGPDLVVPVANGTVRLLSLQKESGGKPSTSP